MYYQTKITRWTPLRVFIWSRLTNGEFPIYNVMKHDFHTGEDFPLWKFRTRECAESAIHNWYKTKGLKRALEVTRNEPFHICDFVSKRAVAKDRPWDTWDITKVDENLRKSNIDFPILHITINRFKVKNHKLYLVYTDYTADEAAWARGEKAHEQLFDVDIDTDDYKRAFEILMNPDFNPEPYDRMWYNPRFLL